MRKGRATPARSKLPLAPRHQGHHSHATSGTSSSAAASQYDTSSLFSMLNTNSTSGSNYLSASQDSLLNSLFGGTSSK